MLVQRSTSSEKNERVSYIDSSIVSEETGIRALPAYACAARWTEGVSDPLGTESIGGHFVFVAVPCDVGLERVDH